MKKKRERIIIRRYCKGELLTVIRLEVGRDNNLKHVALKNIFEGKSVPMSLPTVNRAVATSGLTRKRTKKRPNVLLSDEHRTKVSRFASETEALFNHRILFLDESGFNLHTSNKYRYSMPDTNAIDYNIGNRGRNVSLCSILAASGIIYFETVVGAFNEIVFKQFIINVLGSRNLKVGDVLIIGNASIHKIAPVRELLTQNWVTVKFLPPYSPQFNPIENVSGYIKFKCNNFRPKAKTQEELLCHTDRAIAKFNQLEESVIGNCFQGWRRNLNFALNNRWDEINN